MTLEQLQAELAALPAGRDVPNTISAQEEFWQRRQALSSRINFARMAISTIAEVDPKLADLATWRDHLVEWRKTLCDQLLACPTGRDRATMDRMTGLKLSITAIDRNLDWQNTALPLGMPLDELMKANGYVLGYIPEAWLGCLPDVEDRLAALQRRRDEAQRQLDSALRKEAVTS